MDGPETDAASTESAPQPGRFVFHDVGFHGDLYLLELVEVILSRCLLFVETGANVGSTVSYVAGKHPDLRCLSCEPDAAAFRHVIENTADSPNVKISNETSDSFLRNLLAEPDAREGDVLFWLDAHGYGFDWPLRDEVALITSRLARAYMLIDDFRVPGLDCFGYDRHEEQVCSLEFIESRLDDAHQYRVYYPAYTDRTSSHHPLRGWGLIEFGHTDELVLPAGLRRRIRRAR
ncbi:MAG: hypothetical protein KAS72_10455 [Phycisphaerales bacterium]|nr:hypothetical protein [Phycisphaerales bacterium]